ncbi:hemerythrin domain-containing protein [Paramagnetospirillum kuznetsovii]|nr:hemerythrin domain-containing protein [Paramagnetospirillum kuznetsovii]
MILGLPGIDEDHHRLVAKLDCVCLALHGRNLPAAGRALDDFAVTMVEHFSAEEKLLADMGGGDSDHHISVHRGTADLVDRLRDAITIDQSLAKAEALAAELVNQWIRRLFHEDADLAAKVRDLSPT